MSEIQHNCLLFLQVYGYRLLRGYFVHLGGEYHALPIPNGVYKGLLTRPLSYSASNQGAASPLQAQTTSSYGGIGFVFQGKRIPCRSAIDVLIGILNMIVRTDKRFPQRFLDIPHGKGQKRNYIAQDWKRVHPGRQPLWAKSKVAQLECDWYVDTNLSNEKKEKTLEGVCEVAGLEIDRDVSFNLGDES